MNILNSDKTVIFNNNGLKELGLSYNYLYNGIKIYKIIAIIFLDYCNCMETKKFFWKDSEYLFMLLFCLLRMVFF